MSSDEMDNYEICISGHKYGVQVYSVLPVHMTYVHILVAS